MPISRYNKFFGGGRGAAKKALDAMKQTYGPKKGEQVFWGRIAKLELREKRAKR